MEHTCTLTFDPSEPKRWKKYRVGSCDVDHQQIATLIFQGDRGAVYVTANEGLCWDEEDNIGPHWPKATAEAINLLTPVHTLMSDAGLRARALRMIAAGLAHALQSNGADSSKTDSFVEARTFITSITRQVLQLWYFTSALLFFFITVGTLVALNTRAGQTWDQFTTAAAFGAAGAVISVSQRFQRIAVELYATRKFTAVGGATRVGYGAAFGALFMLFHEAGLVLPVSNSNGALLQAAAFVAGFSERVIPEILQRLEGQLTTKAKK